VSGVERDIGTVAVHWSPEACIADMQASEGGLSKIMSAATNVRITAVPCTAAAAGAVASLRHGLMSCFVINQSVNQKLVSALSTLSQVSLHDNVVSQ